MKTFVLIISESVLNMVSYYLNRKNIPSHLARSIVEFNEETWLEGIERQGRMFTYTTSKY